MSNLGFVPCMIYMCKDTVDLYEIRTRSILDSSKLFPLVAFKEAARSGCYEVVHCPVTRKPPGRRHRTANDVDISNGKTILSI